MKEAIFEVVFGMLGMSGLIYVGLKHYLSKKIGSYFDEKLVRYKHELGLITEGEKFNYQRKIQDFSLYTVKKHEKYVRLHELMLWAEGRIISLFGFRTAPTYEEYNKQDIEKVMHDEDFPIGKRDAIFHLWETSGKESAIKELRSFLRVIQFSKANIALIEFKNEILFSKLYLSRELTDKVEECYKLLADILNKYEDMEDNRRYNQGFNSELRRETRKLEKQLADVRDGIIGLYKKELSVGYYSE
ncbi:MAG: hypothetical protein LWX07_13150 [Bacteroidetes bacterium]|nr:hypothetical protein [Bacteroidota bacterium]